MSKGMKILEPSILSLEDFEECYGRKPEEIECNVDKEEAIISDPIKFDNLLEGSNIEFMSSIDRSEEAYFGQNNEFKIHLIALVSEMRAKYNEIIDEKNKKIKGVLAEDLKPICAKFEKLFESTFNIEKCYFGLFKELNANSLPLCWDKNLVKVTKEGKKIPKRSINNDFRVSLDDIMETKDGYKYRDKTGKIYVINFGLGFFRKNERDEDVFTNEECAAVLTHELGHAMQQAMCSINQNLAFSYIEYLFNEVYNLLNPFVMVGTFGISFLISLFEGAELSYAKHADEDDIGDEIIINNIGANRKANDRDKIGEQALEMRDDTINKMKKEKRKNKKNIFTTIGKFIKGFVMGTFLIFCDILYPIAKLIALPQTIFQLGNIGFLKKNRKFEQFADAFCSMYGLGVEQSSALAKLGELVYKQDYGCLTWINYVPVINIALGFGHYLADASANIIAGYPTNTKRMAAMYKTLQYEIDNNKDLTPEQKSEIIQQLKNMNKVYDDYVYDWSPKGFVYALFHKLAFKKLKNEKSDVEKNVLEALNELKEETKFKEARNKVEKKSDPSRMNDNTLMSAMIAVSRSIKEVGILSGFMKKMEPEIMKTL